MINVEECPVCGSAKFESAFICKDHSISREDFQLTLCSNCNFLMTSPRPESNKLKDYYISENYISHTDTAKGFINKLYHLVRKITLRKKINLIQKYFKRPVLLDIGSGAGYFLHSCAQQGFTVKGVEPDEEARIRSVKQFHIDVSDENILDKMNASGFDVITLWHVLEHVETPDTRMKQIYNLLKPDGIAIIALPNCKSHDAIHYNTYWAGYDVPRHLWHFSPETFQKFIQKHHFELEKTLPMYYDAYYVSMLSEKYKHARFAMIRGLFQGFISNLIARFGKNTNYSSQIYLLRKMSEEL